MAVENLELVLAKASNLSARLWLYGDSFKNNLVGFVVLDPETVFDWLKRDYASTLTALQVQQATQLDSNKLLQVIQQHGPTIRQLVLQGMQQTAKQHKLQPYEVPKAIYLLNADFDASCLTPTFKLVRNALKKKFEKEIEKVC